MLLQYHYAWLEAHSDRTEEWLIKRLSDGFDIHHLDGNHYNNDGKNLVLIESTDHKRLHYNANGLNPKRITKIDVQAIYLAFHKYKISMIKIAEEMGITRQAVWLIAKKKHRKKWTDEVDKNG